MATEDVDLKAGANRVEFSTEIPDGTDVARYRVQVHSAGDQVAKNDSGFVAIQVKGKSKVLVVEGEAGRGKSLIEALRAGGLLIDVVVPQKLPEADSLAYQGIVLADVSVASFTDQPQLDDLAVTTRDLGRGLVTVGDAQLCLRWLPGVQTREVAAGHFGRAGSEAEGNRRRSAGNRHFGIDGCVSLRRER